MKNKSIKNRFGHQITVGARVTVSLVNNPARPVGTVKAIDAKSDFAKAYGPQVSFSDLPHTVTADDCETLPSETTGAHDLLNAAKDAVKKIDQLCDLVNNLSGKLGLGRKVRAEDFSEKLLAAIAKATA